MGAGSRCFSVFASLFMLVATLPAQTTGLEPTATPSESLLREQRHFVECLIYGFSPALWISRGGSLYFMPKSDVQEQRIETMKAEREDYVAFTNLQARYEFAAKLMADSGLDPAWQTKLILPWSPTNRNLIPTLEKPLRLLPVYTLLQTLRDGDALLQEGKYIYFVMDYGRAADDAFRTNCVLVKEGTKTYRTVAGASKTVEAFTDAGLNQEEIEVLNRVVAGLRQKSASLGQALAGYRAKQAFEQHRSLAAESNPYMEFRLASDYLAGTGTPRNEALGLEWMAKAAKHGSGDAEAYLEKLKARQP